MPVLRFFVLSLLLCGAAWAQGLPPQVEADRQLLRAKAAVDASKFGEAVEAFEIASKLNGVKLPENFDFHYGRALLAAKRHELALQRLTRYLSTAGAAGRYYQDALAALNEAETGAAADRAREAEQRKREAANREQEIELRRQREAALGVNGAVVDCNGCPRLLPIPAGRFQMGSADGEGASDERPQHGVSVPAFLLGETEVTQGQWKMVMGSNPSSFKDCGDDCPVENVSWDDAQAFLRKLSAMTGKRYRLPSEAEWEYAARGGTAANYWWGPVASHEYANYGKDDCCGGLAQGRDRWEKTAPVGQFPANAFGLRDMNGNVWEWAQDCWNDSYAGAPSNGAAWESGDCAQRALRGGSWGGTPNYLRAAFRGRSTATVRDGSIGFRVARTAP